MEDMIIGMIGEIFEWVIRRIVDVVDWFFSRKRKAA
jgi:hypothetical protein